MRAGMQGVQFKKRSRIGKKIENLAGSLTPYVLTCPGISICSSRFTAPALTKAGIYRIRLKRKRKCRPQLLMMRGPKFLAEAKRKTMPPEHKINVL